MFERIWVSNRRLSDDFIADAAKIIAYKPVDKILLREADLDERSYENLAKDVLGVVKSSGVKLILHSYFSVAERLGIDELHVPFEPFSKVGRSGFCGKIGFIGAGVWRRLRRGRPYFRYTEPCGRSRARDRIFTRNHRQFRRPRLCDRRYKQWKCRAYRE